MTRPYCVLESPKNKPISKSKCTLLIMPILLSQTCRGFFVISTNRFCKKTKITNFEKKSCFLILLESCAADLCPWFPWRVTYLHVAAYFLIYPLRWAEIRYANSAGPWHFIAIGSFYILEGDRLSETPIVVIRRNSEWPRKGTNLMLEHYIT